MVILIVGKLEYPLLEPHARLKMVQVLGSLVYICGVTVEICGDLQSNQPKSHMQSTNHSCLAL